MTPKKPSRNTYRKGQAGGAPLIPEQAGCGPNVDSWPILDSEGAPIEAEEEEEEE